MLTKLKKGDKVRHKLSGQSMTVKRDGKGPVYTLILDVPEPYLSMGVEMPGDTAICHIDNLELIP